MNSLRQRLVRGGLWVAVGRCSGIALMLVANMLLARAFNTTSKFGLFIVVITLLHLSATAARCGLDRVLVRFITESQSQQNPAGLKSTFLSVIRLGSLSLALAMTVCGLFVAFYGEALAGLPNSILVTAMILLGLATLTLSQFSAETLRGFHNLRLASFFDGQTGGVFVYGLFILFLVCHQVFVATDLTFQNALILYVASLTIPTPIAIWLAWKSYKNNSATNASDFNPSPSSQFSMRAVATIGLPIMLAEFCMIICSYGDILLAAYALGEDQTALYGASKRLMQIVLVPLRLTTLAILSTIPELYSQRRIGELQTVLRTSATYAVLVSLAVLLPLLLMPGTVMGMVFGEPFREAAAIVSILAFGQLIFAMSGTCSLSLMMTGHQRVVLWVNVAVAVSLLTIVPFATQRFGILGLAWVATLHNAGRNILLWMLARRLLGVWTHVDLRQLPSLLSRSRKLLDAR